MPSIGEIWFCLKFRPLTNGCIMVPMSLTAEEGGRIEPTAEAS